MSPSEEPDSVVDQAIESVTRPFRDIEDPVARAQLTGAMLKAIPRLQGELRGIRQDAVLELRREGMSHADVAKELGVSRAQAQHIADGRTSSSAKRRKLAAEEAGPDEG